jgi:hypothetical protein
LRRALASLSCLESGSGADGESIEAGLVDERMIDIHAASRICDLVIPNLGRILGESRLSRKGTIAERLEREIRTIGTGTTAVIMPS